MASFDETVPTMQHTSYNMAVGVPMYFSCHDSNISATQLDLAALPVTPTPYKSAGMDADGYTTLDRTSVTPYQVQQYVGIVKQLETAAGAHNPFLRSSNKNPEYITQEHAHASVIKMAFKVYRPRGHKGCIMRSAGIYAVTPSERVGRHISWAFAACRPTTRPS